MRRGGSTPRHEGTSACPGPVIRIESCSVGILALPGGVLAGDGRQVRGSDHRHAGPPLGGRHDHRRLALPAGSGAARVEQRDGRVMSPGWVAMHSLGRVESDPGRPARPAGPPRTARRAPKGAAGGPAHRPPRPPTGVPSVLWETRHSGRTEAARTMARMLARIASGSVGQAATTAARSGGIGTD
jgi:hypothetical protein